MLSSSVSLVGVELVSKLPTSSRESKEIYRPLLPTFQTKIHFCSQRSRAITKTILTQLEHKSVNTLSGRHLPRRAQAWRRFFLSFSNSSLSPCQFFFILDVGWDLSPLGTSATTGLLYQPRMMDDDECGAVGGMSDREDRSTRRKTCPSAALSTTNPTWPDTGSNPGRSPRKQSSNRLSYLRHIRINSSLCPVVSNLYI
jgi:hypothetical protein